ncbi:MAG: 23S rRNA (adenine2503-C2)-methyltransferase [Candidatus Paceibacteria bacterium]
MGVYAPAVIDLHDPPALAAHCTAHRVDPQQGERLARLVLRYGVRFDEAAGKLRTAVPSAWMEPLRPRALRVVQTQDSQADGATKWLFETKRGERIESVLLRIASGRRALCLTIQSSCPVACRFCASGFPGKPKSLELDSMLGQVLHARQVLRDEGEELRNLVFMGMGEPLLEEELLHQTLHCLLDPRGFAFNPGHVMVSSVGLPEGMLRLAEAFPSVRQALSLHSARQDVRERLIPAASAHPVAELQRVVSELGARTGELVLIEYILLAGVNDGPEDEQALCSWLKGLPVKLNLIPFNMPGDEGGSGSIDATLRPTPRPEREAFARRMRDSGVPTTLRHSLGRDIGAACGQLGRK